MATCPRFKSLPKEANSCQREKRGLRYPLSGNMHTERETEQRVIGREYRGVQITHEVRHRNDNTSFTVHSGVMKASRSIAQKSYF